MKMSGAPCACAKSRSWCTGMKSREAMAPATITVEVTGSSKGGSSSPTAISVDRAEAPGSSVTVPNPRSPAGT